MNRALHAVVLSLAAFEAAAQASPPGVNATTNGIYILVGVVFVVCFVIAFVLSKRRDKAEQEKAGKPPATPAGT